MRIFIYNLREYDEKVYFERFCKEYGCEYGFTNESPTLENAVLAAGFQAISIITTKIDASLMQAFFDIGIRFISTRSIGYDHIDVKKAQELGIRISNVEYSPNSVANYTIMMMLMACRRMEHIIHRMRLQDYTLKGKIGKELSNCIIGVIGTGKIGGTVIQHLYGFGCEILAYDLYPDPKLQGFSKYVSLDVLLNQSDIISLHAPLTQETYHMINKDAFTSMKDGVILINTARGQLIDTPALIEALNSHKVGFAALDVIEDEEGLYYFNRMNQVITNSDFALLGSYPNVLLTPHTAFYTEDAVSEMVKNSIKGICELSRENQSQFEIKYES
jgi:lactate dehydrogenase-like 2-hydroxyacid dehydrogenase